jgi:gluconolactonase
LAPNRRTNKDDCAGLRTAFRTSFIRKSSMSMPLRYRLIALAVVALACTIAFYPRHSAAAAPDLPANMAIPMALKFDRLDPAADRIIPADSVLYRVATGFTWVEGPVWVGDCLYFAEIPSNSIRKFTPGKGTSIWLQPSGYKGATPYGGREPGTNGMTLDAKGRLTVAGHAQRDVLRFESFDSTQPATVLVDSYQGKRLSSPNDLVYASDGSLYFTDPPYGLPTQGDHDPLKQLTVNGVYRIPNALAHKPGAPPDNASLQLLISDLPRPNGIAFSPGEKYLYVNNSEPKKIWMRYTVNPNGSIKDPKLLFDATNDPRVGAPDGMKVDVEGNIYSAGPGGVWIFSPDGKPLATLLIPERVSNVTFGGADRKTLYIAASSSIYRVQLNIAGLPLVQERQRR